jgi:hypothetical protein
VTWTNRLRDHALDVVLVFALAMATFVVHNVSYVLSTPFWTDESWVVISTKLPLHDLRAVSSSTPVGWSLLLRAAVFGGAERFRMIPLVFAALAVAAAYVLVRTVPWREPWFGRLAATLAAGAVLLVPSALFRNDLKQYTADACITLIMLTLLSRLEQHWTRRRVIVLSATCVLGFLFSAVAAFVGAAAFATMILVVLKQRQWARARGLAVVGAITGLLLGLVFLVLYRPGLPPGLNTYWKKYYLPVQDGWGPTSHFLDMRTHQMARYLGMGPLALALPLIVIGVITLIRHRRPALGLAVPVLLVEMMLLGATKKYPLFDLRTSHFLTVSFAVLAAVGVAGVCSLLVRVHRSLAVVAAVAAGALFVSHIHTAIRAKTIPIEDLRTPTQYVEAHRQPNDIIVVGMLSSWGFAYYWHHGTPVLRHDRANLQGFITVFPDQPNILVAKDRTAAAVSAIMDEAAARAALAPGARIWVVHEHTTPAEHEDYVAAFAAHNLQPQDLIVATLVLLTPRGAALDGGTASGQPTGRRSPAASSVAS